MSIKKECIHYIILGTGSVSLCEKNLHSDICEYKLTFSHFKNEVTCPDCLNLINKNDKIFRSNYMQDDVIEACNSLWDNKDELIKKLTIDKIEYGRIIISEFLQRGGQTRQTMVNFYNSLDSKLQNKIIEIGGVPKEITIG